MKEMLESTVVKSTGVKASYEGLFNLSMSSALPCDVPVHRVLARTLLRQTTPFGRRRSSHENGDGHH